MAAAFFDGDLGGTVYQIHALQKFCFVERQLVSGEGGVDHALLKSNSDPAPGTGTTAPSCRGAAPVHMRHPNDSFRIANPVHEYETPIERYCYIMKWGQGCRGRIGAELK